MKVLRVKGTVSDDGQLTLPPLRLPGATSSGPVDVALVISPRNSERPRPETHTKVRLTGGPTMAETILDERTERP